MEAGDRGGGAAVVDAVAGSDGPTEGLAFYAGQSRLTDPGQYAALLDGLPRDVPSLCRVVRGLILHPLTAHLYGVRVPEERLGEQDTRRIEAILARITELDGAPLAAPGRPSGASSAAAGTFRPCCAPCCATRAYRRALAPAWRTTSFPASASTTGSASTGYGATLEDGGS